MSKNRLFAIFILFALLILSAGVSFASDDVDSTINEIDDISIDGYDDISYDIDENNLDDADYDDEDDLDDEDWEDYDDEDDLDDEDWEDYDDEDDLDDEDWEDYDDEDFSGEGYQYGISEDEWEKLHEYYDSFYKNHTLKYHVYYATSTAKGVSYNCVGNYSNDTYSSEDNFTDDNETEEYLEEEIAYCSHGLYIATAAYYCPLMEDASGNQYQNYNPLSDDFDYTNALSDLPSAGDDQNTSKTNGKLDVNKNIELANNSENSLLALFAVLIISILMIL